MTNLGDRGGKDKEMKNLWKELQEKTRAIAPSLLLALVIVFLAAWIMGQDGFPTTGISKTFAILDKVRWDHTVPVLALVIIFVFRKELADRIGALIEGPYGTKFRADARAVAAQVAGPERVLTVTDVQEELKNIHLLDKKKLESDATLAHAWFLQNGIVSKRDLHDLVTQRTVIETLAQIYIEDLKRSAEAPLDPVAIATWGSFMFKNGVRNETVKAVRHFIQQSPEYRAKHPQGNTPES